MLWRAGQRQASIFAGLLFRVGIGIATAKFNRVGRLPIRCQFYTLNNSFIDVVAVIEDVVWILSPAKWLTCDWVILNVAGDLVLEVGVEVGRTETQTLLVIPERTCFVARALFWLQIWIPNDDATITGRTIGTIATARGVSVARRDRANFRGSEAG
ncbi:hypothetical protein FQZ97_1046660 [compost metagenome]